MKRGAIILCGGKSTRMGQDKASLRFGSEQMLQRIVRLVSGIVDPSRIVVVAAAQQIVPELPASVIVARYRQSGRGPLEGFAAGLRIINQKADTVFLTSCDSPRLVPAFVERMFERLGQSVIAVPFDGTYEHPLTAVYRTSILAQVEALLMENRLSPRSLFDKVPTVRISTEEMRGVDPNLSTLDNLNRPEEYRRSLIEMGLEGDQESDSSTFLT